MKRKESLKSPVDLKKTRKSVEGGVTPGKYSVAEQRQRAKEWAENDSKRQTEAGDGDKVDSKRSATASGKTPGKRSKIVYDEDPQPEVQPRKTSRKSIAPPAAPAVEEGITPVEPAKASRKTPAKSRKPQPVESEDEEPVVAPKSARKTPAKKAEPKAAAPATTTSVKTPQTSSKRASVKSEPSREKEVSPVVTPIPVTVPSPLVTPSATPAAKADRTARSPNTTSSISSASRPNRDEDQQSPKDQDEDTTHAVTRRRADSLSPPSSFLNIMVTLYIFIGGIAYFDPQLGFLIFLAVNVLANLFVMSGLNG
jgi:hypothetical protein